MDRERPDPRGSRCADGRDRDPGRPRHGSGADRGPVEPVARGSARSARAGCRHRRARNLADGRRLCAAAPAARGLPARPASRGDQERAGARRREGQHLRLRPVRGTDHLRRDPSRDRVSAECLHDAAARAGGDRLSRAAPRPAPRLALRSRRRGRPHRVLVSPRHLVADRTRSIEPRTGRRSGRHPVDGIQGTLRRGPSGRGARQVPTSARTRAPLPAAKPLEETGRANPAGDHHDDTPIDRIPYRERRRARARRHRRGSIVPARSPGTEGRPPRRLNRRGAATPFRS